MVHNSGWQAMHICSIFCMQHDYHNVTLLPLSITFIIIVHFKSNDLPAMPWSDWETDLGIRTWNFNEFSKPEIIKPHRLCRHFALTEIPFPSKHKVWAIILLDHLTQEPEDFDFDKETI
ncbi:hypothetical protein HETIRDRAFT_419088 [Heterobasidion irregulare TC 32-1]|uniref:Uncharacterized protein n=1 Tax=Heterobasidion irregulare (strain TC 32-1) TaxID=747525 RepID=W4K5Y1_HETIT|nr:uncharacterized protein HETIRDRAFT_419088 [Heterobasidion irregulare TC 32-1]ETW81179.1 hypothetical protein HETIRDRAFT_419088 [Heterobasidion irregulare TC 32-1]